MTAAPGVVAVIAQTKERAKLLAGALGVSDRWAFGTGCNPGTFEGLRASRVLIERDAVVPDDFMSVIRGTVLKMPDGGGKIFYVTAQKIGPTPSRDRLWDYWSPWPPTFVNYRNLYWIAGYRIRKHRSRKTGH